MERHGRRLFEGYETEASLLYALLYPPKSFLGERVPASACGTPDEIRLDRCPERSSKRVTAGGAPVTPIIGGSPYGFLEDGYAR